MRSTKIFKPTSFGEDPLTKYLIVYLESPTMFKLEICPPDGVPSQTRRPSGNVAGSAINNGHCLPSSHH